MKLTDVEPWTLTPTQRFGIVLTLTIAAVLVLVVLLGWATGAIPAGVG